MKRKIYSLLIAISSLSLQAQLSGYSFVKPITVTNTSTASAINYQLKIVVNTQSLISASEMQASGNDIRFGKTCDGSTLYNFWVESGINTATTNIWVKIDTIAAGASKTFFMFHGNASAPAVSAIPGVFVGPHSSTDSVSGANSGGVFNSQRGFRFQPNEDLLVTHFGKNEPNGSTRYITLFDFATQAIITQTQVSGPAASYSYGPISNPLWLMQGTQYILEIFQGSSDGYYFGASPQVGQHLTFLDMRYCNSCTQNTFPTNSLNGMHYGYVDLWYWTKNNITPTPSYTINAGPLQSVTPSTTAICAGNSVTLTATSSLAQPTFTWMPGNISGSSLVVSPATTTSYSLITGAAACTYTLNSAATVSVNPAPIIGITGNNVICGTGTTILGASGASTYSWSTGSTSSSIAVSPTVNTTYTVEGTAAGCTNTAIVTVTVATSPTISILGGTTPICAGSALSLTASGANTYSWNTGASGASIVVTPTSAVSYTATGTSTSGCSGTAVQSITVNPLPAVNATTTSTLLCVGQSATLTATGADTYTWSNASNAVSIVISPTVSTSYTVSGTNTVTGCSNTFTISQNVSTCAGINGSAFENEVVKVYPNPNNGYFTIDMNGNAEVKIYNALGQKVYYHEHENISIVNIQNLQNGIYFMTLTHEGKQVTYKLIKE